MQSTSLLLYLCFLLHFQYPDLLLLFSNISCQCFFAFSHPQTPVRIFQYYRSISVGYCVLFSSTVVYWRFSNGNILTADIKFLGCTVAAACCRGIHVATTSNLRYVSCCLQSIPDAHRMCNNRVRGSNGDLEHMKYAFRYRNQSCVISSEKHSD